MVRSSTLCKKVVQGTVPGKRKRGRQKKRWKDNIREWTGLDFNSSQRAAEDCQRWQKIVADVSSGAPTTLMAPGHRNRKERQSQSSGDCPVVHTWLDTHGWGIIWGLRGLFGCNRICNMAMLPIMVISNKPQQVQNDATQHSRFMLPGYLLFANVSVLLCLPSSESKFCFICQGNHAN